MKLFGYLRRKIIFFILNIAKKIGPSFALKMPGQSSGHTAHYFPKVDRIFGVPSNFA